MQDQLTAQTTPPATPTPYGIDPQKGYTPAEVSAILTIAEGRLTRWRHEANIGKPTNAPVFVKLGRNVVYLGSDLLAWIDQNRVVASQKQSAA